MKNYTFISEFKGKIYIYHQIANNKDDAFILWYKNFICSPFISKMQREHITRAYNDEDDNPCYLVGVSNVLCWWIRAWGKQLLVNYMETINLNCSLAGFSYTFVVFFEGGAYVHQETSIDFKKAYNQWLMYFLTEPEIAQVINDKKREILATYNANMVASLIKKTEYIYELHLTIMGSPFELYITKTPIETE